MKTKFAQAVIAFVCCTTAPVAFAAVDLSTWANTDGTITFQQASIVQFDPFAASGPISYFFVSDPGTLKPITGGLNVALAAGTTIGFQTEIYRSTDSDQLPNDPQIGFKFYDGPLVNINGYTDSLNNLPANPSNSVYWWWDWSLGTASENTGLITVVPEPETYALMLAGLGVLGFMVRRRKA